VFTVSMNAVTLTDTVGREAEHAWNMWASQQLLMDYAAAETMPELGPKALQPVQFAHLLEQAMVGTTYSYYHQSMVRVQVDSQRVEQRESFTEWRARPARQLRGRVPAYCKVPSDAEDEEMQRWIHEEMLARCHPTRLAVVCIRSRRYDAIIPCPQELMDGEAMCRTETKDA
jgi:hypothetical protein